MDKEVECLCCHEVKAVEYFELLDMRNGHKNAINLKLPVKLFIFKSVSHRYIQNHVKHLRWSAFNCFFYSQRGFEFSLCGKSLAISVKILNKSQNCVGTLCSTQSPFKK